jgi:enoyl-CoA hydratase
MNPKRILLDIDGAVATITLNRPDKLNAIDPLMLEQFEATLNDIEQNREVRVVLIIGSGERAFCVGADINAWTALNPLDMWASWTRNGHRVFERLARLRQPVIAVLNGYALGGGLELALAADIRIAATDIELALPEVKIGTTPGWAGTQRLPALIGPARAKQMVFSGSRFDAETAERWGLINQVVPRDVLMTKAKELANDISLNAPISVQISKQMIDGAMGQAVSVALESMAGALTASIADGSEGITAFREHRSPHFKGLTKETNHDSEA